MLDWIGKSKVVNHHLDVPYHVLERKWDFGGDAASGNMVIRGDNLLALKALLPRFAGKVKCIYIDPPYNTGNEGWCYNDNVNDPQIRKWLGAVVGKANVRWWHRIRDRAGFCINGFINHYPDFAVMTERGNLVMVEVKGGHLDGTDIREKAALGRTWADNAGTNFKYFMVFNEEKDAIPEAKSLEDFLTILDNL